MRHQHKISLLAAALLLGAGLTACGGAQSPAGEDGAEGAAGDANMPSVTFADLTDGAEVTSPVEICLDVSGVTIAPAAAMQAGTGHHHIIIDPTPDETVKYTTGTTDPIVNDETHLHLGDGSLCKEVTLIAGEHELLAVVADSAHIPLNPPVVAAVKVMAK